jgi:hydroxyethylthiazole kinase-like uncharacterized protein yjeF
MNHTPGRSQILTVAQAGAADRAALASGTPLFGLMLRAGEAVAGEVMARWTPRPVLVLCGPGDNGGDGFVAASRLAAAGWPVRVAALVGVEGMKGAAAQAAALWRGPVEALSPSCIADAEIVIDALFGAGLSRPLTSEVVQTLQACQAAGAVRVAVDLPSGLAGDTGAPLGFAPEAALTVTFHRKKPAHVLEPGRTLCGEVVVADIGLADPAPDWPLNENGPALWRAAFPWPKTDAHKTERGRMVVVSGDAWSTGAARMAARAGLRIGAGLVTVLSPPDACAVNAAHLEAVMLKPFADRAELLRGAQGCNVAVIGPGAGITPETRLNLLALAQAGSALVVDADIFSVFRDTPDALFEVLTPRDVMTPHAGEFERIFPGLLKSSAEKISAARAAAKAAGAVVLLKGADTVVAAPDGRAVVNTNAAPWLATAGAGDTLAGFIAGLIAQGMESFAAACAGAWIHGEIGRAFGPGLIAEDLPEGAPAVLRRLYAAR